MSGLFNDNKIDNINTEFSNDQIVDEILSFPNMWNWAYRKENNFSKPKKKNICPKIMKLLEMIVNTSGSGCYTGFTYFEKDKDINNLLGRKQGMTYWAGYDFNNWNPNKIDKIFGTSIYFAKDDWYENKFSLFIKDNFENKWVEYKFINTNGSSLFVGTPSQDTLSKFERHYHGVAQFNFASEDIAKTILEKSSLKSYI
jgi:hypothetical protein